MCVVCAFVCLLTGEPVCNACLSFSSIKLDKRNVFPNGNVKYKMWTEIERERGGKATGENWNNNSYKSL